MPSLDDVAVDLLGDAAHHLGALQDGDHVAHGDQVLDLEGGEGAGHGVEAVLVPLEGLQGLVGPVQQAGGELEGVLDRPVVDGDHRQVLGHRDHRHVDGAGHPLGGAVAGAGLRRGHVGVGHQVDVGPGDAAGVGRQDDGAVHLGQLGQALGAELGVEQEAARGRQATPLRGSPTSPGWRRGHGCSSLSSGPGRDRSVRQPWPFRCPGRTPPPLPVS